MGRGKLPMEYIATEKARKSSFKKRREGLVKKIRELSILCGIDACLIIYGPQSNDGVTTEVHTWPKDRVEVERVLKKYELKRNESSSKHLNLIDFFGHQTYKINEQIVKTRREIARAKFAKSVDCKLDGMMNAELKDALVAVDKKTEMALRRIEEEKEKVKLSRGIVKLDEIQMIDSGSQIVQNGNRVVVINEFYNPQSYLGAQVSENFKPLHNCGVDYNAYLPLPSLTDTFITQNNYPADLMGDYVPIGDGQSEYLIGASNFNQFQTQNCEPLYLETSLYSADGVKNNGMGYHVGSYLAVQQQQQHHQQQSLFASVLPCTSFQSGDWSADCYGNFCGWQRNDG